MMKKRGNIFIHFQSFVFYQFKRIDVSKSGGSDAKESACNVGDLGSIPELGRSPEEGIGYTRSSILAWKILWTEEPDRLQSMGLQRVGHD